MENMLSLHEVRKLALERFEKKCTIRRLMNYARENNITCRIIKRRKCYFFNEEQVEEVLAYVERTNKNFGSPEPPFQPPKERIARMTAKFLKENPRRPQGHTE